MSIIFKSKFTRKSLNHLFALEQDYEIYFGEYLNMKKLHCQIEQLISWSEVFRRKQELRPDLNYYIDTYNLTIDKMKNYGPSINPFSLTWTELWEYNSWSDAIEDYNHTFTVENINNLVYLCNLKENNYIGEFYDNDVKIENWVPNIQSWPYGTDDSSVVINCY